MLRILRYLWCLALLIGLFGAPSPAQKPASGHTALTVNIAGLRNAKGMLNVSLFNGSKGFPLSQKDAFRSQVVPCASFASASSGKATVVFRDVPPGVYAVSLVHDENQNGKLDTYWYGKPREGSAVSNNARPKMRAPRFDEASLDLKADKTIELNVWYP